jgi:hypothetical protein
MKTRAETMSGQGLDSYANFIGDDSDYREWFNALGRSRDSGCLENSNFAVGLARMGGEGDDVRVERFGHWMAGWIEEIYVRPGSAAETAAREIRAELDDYPILDEDDHTERQTSEANNVWLECYSPANRCAYIRKHSDEFEFHDFADLMACARGQYFSGYASELIG